MTIDKTVIYTINDIPVHVREQGKGRQTALLVHGWSSSWYALSPLLPLLSERYRCVLVDLPGYGDSPPMRQRATIPLYVELLAELIPEISEGPVVYVGHSMGGMIGVSMALEHPELIERLVLLCPTISGRLSLFINMFLLPFVVLQRFFITDRLVSLIEPAMMSLTDRLLRPALFADQTGITEQDYHKIRADARRPGRGRVRAQCFWAMREHDLRGCLDQITMPGLVIWGMEDNTVPLRDASVVAKEWPDADLRVIPNAGHWPQFETPGLTERYVRAFLSTPLKLLSLEF